MFIIRAGSMTVSKVIGGRSVILSYIPSENYVGEMALLNNEPPLGERDCYSSIE